MNQIQAAIQHVTLLKGKRVFIKSIGDRNRITFIEGTVDGIYPSLFTIIQESDSGPKKKCFSYTDFLTHRLFIKQCK